MVKSRLMKSSIHRLPFVIRAAARLFAAAGSFAVEAGAPPPGPSREPFELTVDSGGFLTFTGGGTWVTPF